MVERKTRVRKGQISNVDKTDIEAIGETAGHALIAQGDDTVDFQQVALPGDVETFYAESEGETATTSAAYIQKLRLTFTPTTSGDYLIEWCGEILIVNKEIGYQIHQDDTIILNEGEENKGAADYKIISGFKKITGVASTPINIDFDILSVGGSSVTIRRARLVARRL